MDQYVSMLLDPFDADVQHPKLLDGKVSRSAGIKLRATGTVACDPVATTWFALIPGMSHALLFKTAPSVDTSPPPFFGHLGSVIDRTYVKQARIVGAGLRLTLINNADQNEGYWEAARVPFNLSEFLGADGTTGVLALPAFLTGEMDLSNHATYQTGKLRDLHRYQFKLNSVDTEHVFSDFSDANVAPNTDVFLDQAWDMVLVKVHGRADATSPSVLMYESVSNQEVIYQENTALARLMTKSPRLAKFQDVLEQTKYDLAAVQIS
jgi:hypothetical protein